MVATSVLVLGAGAWGTALAIQLTRNNHTVYLWGRNAQLINTLSAERCNRRYLPGVNFSDRLLPLFDLGQLPQTICNIVIAVPSHALPCVLAHIKHLKNMQICISCKGLTPDNAQRLNHDIVRAALGEVPVSVLSGPSFAKEVAQGLPTAVTVAAQDLAQAAHFATLFYSKNFRTYTHDDLVGVQIAGAIKNIMAIAAGVADGFNYGSNARAALITRGLNEIRRLGVALGARPATFQGLAGLGDLILTCTDDQSRNRRFGLALAKGASQQQAKQDIGQEVEGIKTTVAAYQLALQHNIEMPITEQVAKLISGQVSPRVAAELLLSRKPKAELYEKS